MHETADSSLQRRRAIIIGSVAIALFVLIAAGGVGGSALLALNARNQALAAQHDHAAVSVQQACGHWGLIWAATAHDGTPVLHEAVGKVLAQLRCPR